jgi:uncharacterized FAD-dependent dehydrogenase
MLRIDGIKMPPDHEEEELLLKACRLLRLSPKQIGKWSVLKKSIDARNKRAVSIVYSLAVALDGDEEAFLRRRGRANISPYEQAEPYLIPHMSLGQKTAPVIVGMGPAGLFAGLYLTRAGLKPILWEMGKAVEERAKDVEAFWAGGALQPRSNVQFGEGGAGAFSDGKLNTGIKDKRISFVLRELAAHGAPQEILYQSKPHIGTDYLPQVVRNIRNEILAGGGQVHFNTMLRQLQIKKGRLYSIISQGPVGMIELQCERLILAIGHSSRPTFAMLCQNGLLLQPKPFSVGLRIEHRQDFINRLQYGDFACSGLGAADYKLSCHLPNGRSVYTFCMCPGGQVVAAASEEGGVVTNGMSPFLRDGANANSAVLVGVDSCDFPGDHPLAGIDLQRQIEQKSFVLGGGNYYAPSQWADEFLSMLTNGGRTLQPTYRPGVKYCDLAACFPQVITDALRLGLAEFQRRMPGFCGPDALLTAAETRSSSPVRIMRNQSLESSLTGIYPCGEGSGYAGGIMSAAVDGLKAAESVAAAYGKQLI